MRLFRFTSASIIMLSVLGGLAGAQWDGVMYGLLNAAGPDPSGMQAVLGAFGPTPSGVHGVRGERNRNGW